MTTVGRGLTTSVGSAGDPGGDARALARAASGGGAGGSGRRRLLGGRGRLASATLAEVLLEVVVLRVRV